MAKRHGGGGRSRTYSSGFKARCLANRLATPLFLFDLKVTREVTSGYTAPN